MADPRSDEELIAALRKGDPLAFAALYPRYEARLYGYVRRMVGDPGVADDMFQDIFLSVLRDRSFDPRRGRFAPWLFRVAQNRCLMHRRGSARRAKAMREAETAAALQAKLPDLARDLRVRAAIDRLDENQRQLLLLKQVAELTYREIGELLDIKEGTVKSRLHAAMSAFRQQLILRGDLS